MIGHWSLVIGHWSLVIGHWSLVIGHWEQSIALLRQVRTFSTVPCSLFPVPCWD
ncbi:hypothetical protein [Coleofasciculus sp. E1-EBD-02]|uniref:hypothetical protein n=1 Tax=Coleofasciculus sp. E1-EBD-02 TaxID=3068481 RepID=UPI0032F621D4